MPSALNEMDTFNHTRWLLRLLIFSVVLRCVSALADDSEPHTAPDTQIVSVADIEKLRSSAQSGSGAAQYALGLRYEYGRGIDQSDSQAMFWYKKSAVQGVASAQYRLAVLLDNGWGGTVNKQQAFAWYKAAAEQGIALAQHDLAIAYFQGSGTERNLMQSFMWLKIADLNGSPLMQKHLKLVAAEMTADEIETARHLADYWADYWAEHRAGH